MRNSAEGGGAIFAAYVGRSFRVNDFNPSFCKSLVRRSLWIGNGILR